MNKLKSLGATTVISKNLIKGVFSLVFLWFMFSSQSVLAEISCDNGLTCTQTIELKPGWNSIFVQVKPDADATDEVFADLLDGDNSKVSSVWTWLAHRAKIDFIQDPNSEKLLSQEGWLRYFPDETKNSFLTNLYAIQGNRAYLVKLEGTATVMVSITGQPVMPRAQWESNSFNHLGLHVDPQNLPTFYDYFSASAAHSDQPIYQLVNNEWQVVDVLNTIIKPDVAYWVFSKTGSDYLGPLEVELPQVDRLEYGSLLEQFTARLKNKTNSEQSISLQILGDAAGMYYPNPDVISEESWLPLPNPLTVQVALDGESRVPLGVRRADFTPGDFSQVLAISSSSGSRWLIPVTASAPKLNSLWVGSVTIDSVSQVQNYKHDCLIPAYTETDYVQADGVLVDGVLSDGVVTEVQVGEEVPEDPYGLCVDVNGEPINLGNTLAPVETEFSFRVIMHRDGTQVRLLKDVIQMSKPAVVDADGTVTEPGRYVLLTDDTLIPNYQGVALRDGEAVGRRMSTTAYDFEGESLDMTGSLETAVIAELTLSKDAPSNPYRHEYHQQHKEGYTITRTMEFTFETIDNGLGASYDNKGGTYRETITGLHKNQIITAGRFVLNHAAQINTLNDTPTQ